MPCQSLQEFLEYVKTRNPYLPEFNQSVSEVMMTLWPFLEQNPHYKKHAVLERLVEPDRMISFRVAWIDDAEQVQVHRGYRIQHSNALGPYKGGMRFHPTVNSSILRFLAFEQTFKNALTTLPMGSGKGGSNFDPRGRSDEEIMRFCQAFMTELYRHIGANVDVPAGDIGVGAREVGYMTGMMKKLSNDTGCVFTGKGLSFGGSLLRTEATGYGLVYFAQNMLKHANIPFEGLRVLVSGSGNVAQHAIERAMLDGAIVLTASDSNGTAYLKDGFTPETLQQLKDIKNIQRLRISDFAAAVGAEYIANQTPWHIPTDVALPCATQNELHADDAKTLLANGVQCVAEGANMPCTNEAISLFEQAQILYAPGKASNAGGVATSGLEMSQNAMRQFWSRDEVDHKLRAIMYQIHDSCLRYGLRQDHTVSYAAGANIAGFVQVADAMIQQGVL
ncbi:MAG: NADP-specific glutamate dehydrogenase [Pseudomonadota bacterium]|nr:NADP-specific glutamate dehydrogenase [Pseudomonadota bacterium]